MATIGFLLTTGPYQVQNYETLANTAEAALDKGHQVKIFMYLDGVYNPIKYQKFPDMEILPMHKFEKLLTKGAEITACGICVNARGLEGGKDFMEGVKVGGLPDFAEIVGEVDRLVTL